jgi:hypothetical protein
MEWKSATSKDDGTVALPERWLFLHYYEALNILFRMENALRVFAYVVLKNRFKEKWAETAMQTADEEAATIASTAAKRQAQARGFGYLGYEITSPLMYLNSGELTNIICSETYWNLFKPFFRGKKEIIKNKLDEIGTVRNSLAHFRPIKHDDIELIKQNIKHAFVGIELCLTEMMRTYQTVPTNTEGEWYKNLTTLGSNRCTVQLFQNSSENWIRSELDYVCAVFGDDIGSTFRRLSIAKLISPAVIKTFPSLARHCIFVTESIRFPSLKEGEEPHIVKALSLVFHRQTVAEHHKEIVDQLKEILLKIENETELVQKDNLARGQLIDSARVTLRKNAESQTWRQINATNLRCSFAENDPPEYWGNIGLYESDFIAASVRYPWMPSDISKEEEIPF